MDGKNQPEFPKAEFARAAYVHMDDFDWQPFPEEFSKGGIRWKLLHVSPETGAQIDGRVILRRDGQPIIQGH